LSLKRFFELYPEYSFTYGDRQMESLLEFMIVTILTAIISGISYDLLKKLLSKIREHLNKKPYQYT
jgi:divalent metal cation (Fe/Co/Zn/Cd) transporter